MATTKSDQPKSSANRAMVPLVITFLIVLLFLIAVATWKSVSELSLARGSQQSSTSPNSTQMPAMPGMNH